MNPTRPRLDRLDWLLLAFIVACLLGLLGMRSLHAAPPLPDDPGAPQALNAGDVLNPEFPAAPLSDPSAWSDVSDMHAGEPGPTPEPEYEWYIPTWAKWLSGAVGTALAGWYAIEKVDLHEDDSDPAPPAVTPAARAAAGDSLGGGPTDRYTVTLTGYFVGPAQSVVCNGATKSFAPGLAFAQGAQGVKGGAITAYISSQVCAVEGPMAGSSWTPGTDGEIVILCPDPFYVGPAALTGNSLILSNGTRLSGGTILITPVEGAP